MITTVATLGTEDVLADALTCPGCRENYLRHREVNVYSRPKESEPGFSTLVRENGQTTTIQAESAAFLGRRHDLRIQFTCEGCHKTSWLCIVQHKGQTFLTWRNKP